MKIKHIIIVLVMGLLGATVLTFLPKHHHHYVKKTEQTIHVYRTHASDKPDDWIYWYIFYYNNLCYYSSDDKLLVAPSYSGLKWEQVSRAPIDEKSLEEVDQAVVPNEELGPEISHTIEAQESTAAQEDTMINEGNPNCEPPEPPTDVQASDTAVGGTDSGGSSDGGAGSSGGGDE